MSTDRRGPGRQRRPENAWLPPYVQRYKLGYPYRNRSTGELRHVAGREASKAEVWAAYDNFVRPRAVTLDNVLDQYFRSPQFALLKPATQSDYLQYAVKVRAVFGQALPDAITSPDVQRFMDLRGANYPTAANHEKAFLSLAMNWGKARGYVSIPNPCQAVRSCRTQAGGRYVSHQEFHSFHQFLIDRGHPMHAAAMGIAYLCGSRQQDVLRLQRRRPLQPGPEDCWVCDEGLVIWQAKTGKVQLKVWNADLRSQVELALAVETRFDSLHVLRSRGGHPFTRGGFNSSWTRCQQAALESGVLQQRFRFHDLKIKALSDYEGADLAHFSGHRTKGMAERYNRTPDRVDALELPGKQKPE